MGLAGSSLTGPGPASTNRPRSMDRHLTDRDIAGFPRGSTILAGSYAFTSRLLASSGHFQTIQRIRSAHGQQYEN